MLEIARRIVSRKRERLSGGEAIARMLAAEGVEKVFGIIDGTYFGFYASLRKVGIDLITPRHETSAAHMAGAYARLTGRLGVCMASNGPGVANVLPGVAVENAEGNRVLLITSARREGTIAPDRYGTYQSFPQVEVTAPMTKWSCRVPSFGRLAEIVRRALRVSFSGRPGVVHVDVPENIMNGSLDVGPGFVQEPRRYRNVEPLHPSPSQVERAADLLVDARFPLIHAGSGVLHARASAELAELAEMLRAPVTTSWAARGATSEAPEWSVPLPYIGLVNEVRNAADVVLALGSRIGETDWWGKPPYWAPPSRQRLIQVDVDEQSLGVHRPAELGIVADAKVFLRSLVAAVRARRGRLDEAAGRARIAAVAAKRARARAALDRKLDDHGAPLGSAHVGDVCRKVLRDDAVVVLDGGNAAVWGHFYFEVRSPGTLAWTPKMGMLGAGVAQALGAKVAAPGRQVCCIIGDGAMGMQQQEIETAVRNGLGVVYIVLCDRQWGMVKINQSFTLRPLKTLLMGALGPGENINSDFSETRYDKLAQAMGAHGERASDPEALERALRRCISLGRPSVIHVDVDPVKHMWAPGLREFKAMHAEPRG